MSTKKIQIIGNLGSNVELDTTLIEAGKAADAKAVGDALAQKADSTHNHSYNDLTDKPTIPSIEGLATTDYVDEQVENAKQILVTVNQSTGKASMTSSEIFTAMGNGSTVILSLEIESRVAFLSIYGWDSRGIWFSLEGWTSEGFGNLVACIDDGGNIYTEQAVIPTLNDLTTAINSHNTSNTAHADIRSAITAKADAVHSHSYNDLTDKPTIPSIAGLATETYVDEKISEIPTPDVSGQINTHNVAVDAHNDIRVLIDGLTTRLNTLANSDDATLDQMSEVVAYIKSNKNLIDAVTTNKVNVSDIINNLTTNVSNKPLSAAQGVALKSLIDALQEEFDGHTHAIADVSGLQSALDNLIIYVTLDDSTGKASMTSSEILAAVQSGADVIADYHGVYSRLLVVDENSTARFSSVHTSIDETEDSVIHSIIVSDNGTFSRNIDSIPNTSRVSHIITPQQYGAVGDGITDDSAAIQQAINAAIKQATDNGYAYYLKPIVYLDAKVYKISTGLVLDSRCLQFHCDGIIEYDGTGAAVSVMHSNMNIYINNIKAPNGTALYLTGAEHQCITNNIKVNRIDQSVKGLYLHNYGESNGMFYNQINIGTICGTDACIEFYAEKGYINENHFWLGKLWGAETGIKIHRPAGVSGTGIV